MAAGAAATVWSKLGGNGAVTGAAAHAAARHKNTTGHTETLFLTMLHYRKVIAWLG
jgi:hypothetical protein